MTDDRDDRNNESEYCFGSIESLGKIPKLIKMMHEEERAYTSEQRLDRCIERIKGWEYAYCVDCGRIRYSAELEATAEGIRCSKCGGYNLEAPGWAVCPYYGDTAVKCPRGGRSIVKTVRGAECHEYCPFRLSV